MNINIKFLYDLWVTLSDTMSWLLSVFSYKWSSLAADLINSGDPIQKVIGEFFALFVDVVGDYTIFEYIFGFGLITVIIYGIVSTSIKLFTD